MALEQLSLAQAPVDVNADVVPIAGGYRRPPLDGGYDGNRVPRLPRWTRQEILVLIQGKRAAENGVRRGRTVGMAFGSGQVEPKWDSVSSYCKRYGVNRGPVQCRKRWSNLAGDYKKIKEWESQVREELESYWAMRNDLRRARKLPGFFDREVYDTLEGGTTASVIATGLGLALAPWTAKEGEEAGAVEAATIFGSGRSAGAEDGFFSVFDSAKEEGDSDFPPPNEVRMENTSIPDPVPISGTTHGKRQTSVPEMEATFQEVRKRKRFAADGDKEANTLQSQLVQVLEHNGSMVSEQLESQNTNFQLDREQRKEHVNSLVVVLSKLGHALDRIADKL